MSKTWMLTKEEVTDAMRYYFEVYVDWVIWDV